MKKENTCNIQSNGTPIWWTSLVHGVHFLDMAIIRCCSEQVCVCVFVKYLSIQHQMRWHFFMVMHHDVMSQPSAPWWCWVALRESSHHGSFGKVETWKALASHFVWYMTVYAEWTKFMKHPTSGPNSSHQEDIRVWYSKYYVYIYIYVCVSFS